MKIYKAALILFLFFWNYSISAQLIKPGSPFIPSAFVSDVTSNSAKLNAKVNPNGDNTATWFNIYIGNARQESGYQNIGNGTKSINLQPYIITGLQPNTTYKFGVEARNNVGNSVSSFVNFTTKGSSIKNSISSQNGISPSVEKGLVLEITSRSAILSGIVNPNGSICNVWYETPNSEPLQIHTLNGSKPVRTESYKYSNLTPNTKYQFRVLASNQYGINQSDWLTFTTTMADPIVNAPIVKTFPPTINSTFISDITSTSAIFKGSVNPNGEITYASFLTSASDGGPFQQQKLSSTTKVSNLLDYQISNLNPNTKYRFKIFASNKNGTIVGDWFDFTTLKQPFDSVDHAPIFIESNVSNISTNSAKIVAKINPHGDSTAVWYKISLDSLGIQKTNSDTVDITLDTFFLGGLSPNSTYKLQVIADNNYGTSFGNIISFKTQAYINQDSINENLIYSKRIAELIDSTTDHKEDVLGNSDELNKLKIEYSLKFQKLRKKENKKISRISDRLSELKINPLLSELDIERVFDINNQLDKLQQHFNEFDFNDSKSAYILSYNFNFALCSILHPKQIKKIPDFIIKYSYLISNLDALYSYLNKPDFGNNLFNNEDIIGISTLSVPLLGSSFLRKIASDNVGSMYDGKIPVCVNAYKADSNGNISPRNGLTVKYNFKYQLKEIEEPFEFRQVTSPSCDFVAPLKWYFWLVDSSIESSPHVSETKYVNLTEVTEKEFPIVVDILIYKK